MKNAFENIQKTIEDKNIEESKKYLNLKYLQLQIPKISLKNLWIYVINLLILSNKIHTK